MTLPCLTIRPSNQSTISWLPDRIARMLANIAVLLPCCSCGSDRPEMVPVTGVVLVDGKPIESAQVMFQPTGNRPAAGTTDASGHFRLSTFEPNDGAVVGAHRITVTFRRPIRVDAEPEFKPGQPMPRAYGPDWKSPVPARYSNFDTSGLAESVEADGSNDFKLELTAKE